jgi:long-chain acyl-CoA synthetase
MLERRAASPRGRKPYLIGLENDQLVTTDLQMFWQQAGDWSQCLRERGVKRGDRVVFITAKSALQQRVFFACWWLGAIAVPVCETLGDLEMGFIIRDCEPALVLVQKALWQKVENNAGDIQMMDLESFPVRRDGFGAPPPVDEADDEDVAALIYTSGSTGMPKGVMLTHRNFYRNAECCLTAIDLYDTDTLISLLPYWHCFALVVEVVLPVVTEGVGVIVPLSQKDFKQNIARYRPTIMLVVPRIADTLKTGIERSIEAKGGKLQQLFDKAIHNASRIFTAGPKLEGGLLRLATHHAFYDPLIFRSIRKRFGGRMRCIISGGAPLDMEHQIFFKYLGLPIYQGYGLTESTPVVSVNGEVRHKIGSCGPILSWLTPEGGGDFMFRDDHGETGKTIAGELLLKGDCVMKGYWRHRDQSAKILADGWLHTGDMAYMDDDGYLFIEGRKGSMIVLGGGEKLHPEHVEDVVKNADLVTEAMVIGEGCKNVYACVNVDPDRAACIPPAELDKTVRAQVIEKVQHLAVFQRPKDVLILPAFCQEDGTLTATFKIRRHKIREKYGDRIRQFLMSCGEELATKEEIGIASSKIMESLGKK